MRIDFGTPTKEGETVSVLFLPSASMLIAVCGDRVFVSLFEEGKAAVVSREEAITILDYVERSRGTVLPSLNEEEETWLGRLKRSQT